MTGSRLNVVSWYLSSQVFMVSSGLWVMRSTIASRTTPANMPIVTEVVKFKLILMCFLDSHE